MVKNKIKPKIKRKGKNVQLILSIGVCGFIFVKLANLLKFVTPN